jgi:hypothetical protein
MKTLNTNEKSPYYVKFEPYETKPGCWNYNRVDIYERESNQVIGSYTRNYSSMYRTFYPFELRGNWYALYSKNYTTTRIMSLPDCVDIGGEENEAYGFCPTDYFVPELNYIKTLHFDDCPAKLDDLKICNCFSHFQHRIGCSFHPDSIIKNQTCICKEERKIYDDKMYVWTPIDSVHGFIAGCIWGDDSSWKIQYLDLSQADKGIIKREERFGYISLPHNLNLDQAIKIDCDGPGINEWLLSISTENYYDFKTGDKK